MTERETIIKWWHTLSPIEQQEYFLEYQELYFTPAQNFPHLTGREIAIIYNTLKKD